MISLICLPLLCVGYFAQTTGFKQLALMDVELVYPMIEHVKSTGQQKGSEIFAITGQANTDQKLLTQIVDRCKVISKAKHSKESVVVAFSTTSKYADFVKVFEDTYAYKDSLSFRLYGNKVLIQNGSKNQTKPKFLSLDVITCGTVIGDTSFFKYNPVGVLLVRVGDVLKEYWPSVMAFLIMIFFAFYDRRGWKRISDQK